VLGLYDTPIKMIRANNVLKYQFLDQLLAQYIILNTKCALARS
jgi:hypothetical protein